MLIVGRERFILPEASIINTAIPCHHGKSLPDIAQKGEIMPGES
jgi:hypothetical protein